jgi:hypothetical protein
MAERSNSTRDDSPITEVEIKTALQNSGYLVEGRVSAILEAHDFKAVLNPLFGSGPELEKCEIDVMAVMGLEFGPAPGNWSGVKLFVECKNNEHPIVFFSKNTHAPSSVSRVLVRGYPSYSRETEESESESIPDLLEMEKWHHYGTHDHVCSQLCGFEEKGSQERAPRTWRATSLRQYFEAMTNLCECAISYKHPFDTSVMAIELELYYPILVLAGRMYEARSLAGKDVELIPRDHVQYRHGCAHGTRFIPVLIDVVTEEGLPALLATIKTELNQLTAGIEKQYRRLHYSACCQKSHDRMTGGRS